MKGMAVTNVRAGTLTLSDLLGIARELVTDDEGREALYDHVRSRTSAAVRGDEVSEINGVGDALSQIAGLARSYAEDPKLDPLTLLAARLDTLVDLAADANARAETYAVDRLKDQPHFQRCLGLLEGSADQRMLRTDLLKALGLKEGNGTRVIKVLESAGLVRRSRSSTVTVTLTLAGRRALVAWRTQDIGSVEAPVLSLSSRIPGVTESAWRADKPARRVATR